MTVNKKWETQLSSELQKKWKEASFAEPSLIQAKTYQPLAAGKNLIGLAPTGSGKTLAYLLPLLPKLAAGGGSQLLIILPAQELAAQVAQVVRAWMDTTAIQVQLLIGGGNIQRQIDKLKRRPEILIGTSGRIVELIQRKKLKLTNIQTLILDEADQFFAEDQHCQAILTIVRQLPDTVQLVAFSATGENLQNDLAQLSTTTFVEVDVRDSDQSRAKLTHCFLRIPARKRVDTLRKLAYIEGFQALVFFNQLEDVRAAEQKLLYEGVDVAALTSMETKLLREAAMKKFRKGDLRLLLTTDLAARGLDFPELPYVVQYDIAVDDKSYLHRSGRTGRMGHAGKVLTFVNSQNDYIYERQLKNGGYQAAEVFLYAGQLQDQAPEKPLANHQVDQESVKEHLKQKAVSGKLLRVQAADQTAKKKTKKKNRIKKQKNKGARRTGSGQ